jgi:succinoglycan biosynthesis protein ExoL
MTIKVLLLAHDLSDPAIGRRAAMLKAGGATLTLAGFRRSEEKIAELCGCRALDFGRTHNSAFLHRIFSVLRIILFLHRYRDFFSGADIILARNLEMLAIAVRAQRLMRPKPIIVYELLDIHRLLLKKNAAGFVLRAFEAFCVRCSAAIVTSSPAFIANYIGRFSRMNLPVRLVENKLLDSDGKLPAPQNNRRPPAPPWRIGWFGILRCRRSLLILQELVRTNQGRVEVVLRGRPALNEIKDFHEIVAATPGLSFRGPYKNPEELAAIYGEIHFIWAIDMYEEGQNSAWLLPNRLYEGGFFGAVPLALGGIETSDFLRRLDCGVILKQPLSSELVNFFATFVPDSYNTFTAAVLKVPRSVWVYDQKDCRAFVDWLHELQPSGRATNG